MTFASCSKDDDETGADKIKVYFYLTNEKGEKTTTFKSGENIVLCANLQNSTSEAIVLFDETDHSHEPEWKDFDNLFAIYEKSGKLIGKAWDGISLGEIRIQAGETIHWQCYWMEHTTEMPNIPPFVIKDIKEQLPKGEYYVLFSHYLINNSKNYKVNFKVQ